MKDINICSLVQAAPVLHTFKQGSLEPESLLGSHQQQVSLRGLLCPKIKSQVSELHSSDLRHTKPQYTLEKMAQSRCVLGKSEKHEEQKFHLQVLSWRTRLARRANGITHTCAAWSWASLPAVVENMCIMAICSLLWIKSWEVEGGTYPLHEQVQYLSSL